MKITILVCTLNEEVNIQSRIINLASLERPENLELEVYILDNGSTDKTYEIACNLCNVYDIPIQVCKLGSIGKCASLFWAYENVDSDYFLMTDANTVFNSSYVIETVRAIRSNEKSMVYIGNFKSVLSSKDGENFLSNNSSMSIRHVVEEYFNVTSGANGACYCVNSKSIVDIWKFPAVRNDDFVISVYAFSHGSAKILPRAKAYEVENLSSLEVFQQKYRDALGHHQAITWLLNLSFSLKLYLSVILRLIYWSAFIFLTILFIYLFGWWGFYTLLLAFILVKRVRRLFLRGFALYVGYIVGLVKKPEAKWITKR